MVTNIPEDIVMMILRGLPVKSLLQFKSVCKNWYNLIESQDFVAKHFQYQKCNNRGRLLLKMKDNESRNDYILHDSETIGGSTYEKFEKVELNKLDVFPCEKKMKNNFRPWLLRPRVKWLLCAPVKGLCCITNVEDLHIIIWNPASKEYRALPLPDDRSYTENCCHSVGFGLDHETDDCKLVLTIHDDSYVYSLRKNTWKKLPVTKRESRIGTLLRNPAGEHLNGVCYWLSLYEPIVYTFNISKQSFGVINIRPSCDHMRLMLEMPRRCDLTTCDDRLLFVIFTLNDDYTPGIHTSTVDNEELVCVQHMCTMKGCHFGGDIRLWKNKEDFCIVYAKKIYNVTTKEEVKQFGKGEIPWEAHAYHESLASVKGGETTRTTKPY